MTEPVYEAVKGSFGVISLDNVQPEALGYSLKLYALVRPRPFGAQDTRLHTYKKGFSKLLQGQYPEAQQHFAQYLQDPEPEGDVVPHAKRLLRVAVRHQRRQPGRRAFCRADGWDSDSSGGSDELYGSLSRMQHLSSDSSDGATLQRCATALGRQATPLRLPHSATSAPAMTDPARQCGPRRHSLSTPKPRPRWDEQCLPRCKTVDAEPGSLLFLPIPVAAAPPVASPMARGRSGSLDFPDSRQGTFWRETTGCSDTSNAIPEELWRALLHKHISSQRMLCPQAATPPGNGSPETSRDASPRRDLGNLPELANLPDLANIPDLANLPDLANIPDVSNLRELVNLPGVPQLATPVLSPQGSEILLAQSSEILCEPSPEHAGDGAPVVSLTTPGPTDDEDSASDTETVLAPEIGIVAPPPAADPPGLDAWGEGLGPVQLSASFPPRGRRGQYLHPASCGRAGTPRQPPAWDPSSRSPGAPGPRPPQRPAPEGGPGNDDLARVPSEARPGGAAPPHSPAPGGTRRVPPAPVADAPFARVSSAPSSPRDEGGAGDIAHSSSDPYSYSGSSHDLTGGDPFRYSHKEPFRYSYTDREVTPHSDALEWDGAFRYSTSDCGRYSSDPSRYSYSDYSAHRDPSAAAAPASGGASPQSDAAPSPASARSAPWEDAPPPALERPETDALQHFPSLLQIPSVCVDGPDRLAESIGDTDTDEEAAPDAGGPAAAAGGPGLPSAFAFETSGRRTKRWVCSSAVLGAGGFGTVYLGMSDEGKLVAIKQLEMASRDVNLALLNELRMLSSLKHRHIVAYLGSAVVGSHVMVIMEYACTTLAKVRGRGGGWCAAGGGGGPGLSGREAPNPP